MSSQKGNLSSPGILSCRTDANNVCLLIIYTDKLEKILRPDFPSFGKDFVTAKKDLFKNLLSPPDTCAYPYGL